MQIFKHTNFDFLRWRWQAIALSWVVILAGLVTIWTRGIPKGVEFAGGTVVIEQFEQAVSVEQVRTELLKSGGQRKDIKTIGVTAGRPGALRRCSVSCISVPGPPTE